MTRRQKRYIHQNLIVKQGPHVPNPQSQPFSQNYGSKLPISLAHLSSADKRLPTLETWCSSGYSHQWTEPHHWLFKSSWEYTRHPISQGKIATIQPHLHATRFQGNLWLESKGLTSQDSTVVAPRSADVTWYQLQPDHRMWTLLPFEWWGKSLHTKSNPCNQGLTNSWSTSVRMKPCPTSIFKVLIWILATTTKICNKKGSFTQISTPNISTNPYTLLFIIACNM